MARITKMPPRILYGPYRGYFDWYTWKGLACVRQWPRRMTATPRALASWQNLINATSQWARFNARAKQAFYRMAKHAGLTGRDIFEHYFMRVPFPGENYPVEAVWTEGGVVHIAFNKAAGPGGNLMCRYTDNDRVSDVIEWRGIGEPYCRARYTDFFFPVFRGFEEVQVQWGPNDGEAIYKLEPRHLWFYFPDITGTTEYSTGLYRELIS